LVNNLISLEGALVWPYILVQLTLSLQVSLTMDLCETCSKLKLKYYKPFGDSMNDCPNYWVIPDGQIVTIRIIIYCLGEFQELQDSANSGCSGCSFFCDSIRSETQIYNESKSLLYLEYDNHYPLEWTLTPTLPPLLPQGTDIPRNKEFPRWSIDGEFTFTRSKYYDFLGSPARDRSSRAFGRPVVFELSLPIGKLVWQNLGSLGVRLAESYKNIIWLM
jgi:hypothetical protein